MKQNLPDLEKMTYVQKAQLLRALKEDIGGASRFDTDEFMELSLQWAKGEIPVTVVRELIGHNNYAACVAIGLRRAVKQGRLVEK